MTSTRPDSSATWVTRAEGLGFEAEQMHADLQARMFGMATAPVRLGRFVVLEQLGRGGMGVVYSAYDPTLDRKIAVKLVHRDRASPSAARALVAEAQALARLSHPNVIAVHDVGDIDDQIFIAMELVDGAPLSRWQQDHADDWRAVLDAYLAAGEGLAAAHRAGLVHRDFKPDNVLVDTEGRVRVLDFGLARVAQRRAESLDEDGNEALPGIDTTSIAGTLPYMSPEQVLGVELDARTDQFSFCVALSEALYARHPFARGPAMSTATAIVDGELQTELVREGVPTAVRDVLLRGMSTDRGQRFDDMPTLLAALREALPSPRSSRWIAWLLPIALLAGYGIASLPDDDAASCARGEQQIAAVWSPAVATEIEAAFVGASQPRAASIWSSTRTSLDERATRWAAVRREVCEATVVHGEQSAELLDSRMRCLDRRLGELTELLRRFAVADARTVSHAIAAVHGLPRPEDCATQALGGAGTRPAAEDVEAYRELDELQARSVAMRLTGDYPGATTAAEQALTLARSLDDARRTAELLLLRAKYDMHDYDWNAAVPRLQEVMVQAERASADELRGLALGEMAMVHANLGRLDDSLRFGELSRAARARAGMSTVARVQHDSAMAWLHLHAGHFEQADALLGTAREQAESLGPEDQQIVALLYNTVGLVQRERGELEAAVESLERSYSICTETFGEDHPETAMIRVNLGGVLLDVDRIDEALTHLRAALEIYSLSLGPDSIAVADAAAMLADALALAKQPQEARQHYERALAIYAAKGEDGEVEVARTLGAMATMFREQGRAAEALPVHRRSLRLWEKHLGPDHLDLSYSLVGIGFDLVELDRHAEAVEPLERALALRESSGIRAAAVAEARFGLARALAPTDLARATALARTALAEYAEAGDEGWRARVEAFLAEHSDPEPP